MDAIMHDKKKQDYIDHNQKIHDTVSKSYNLTHTEIFNPTEEKRILISINECLSNIKSAENRLPRVLDFGAGTGNLTNHLLKLGVNVVASDVSTLSLAYLKSMHVGNGKLEIFNLNGNNLSEFADNSFDMISTYSVLHHVPDYLLIIQEFLRVLKPGGIIYIDHEACPNYWEPSNHYKKYMQKLNNSRKQTLVTTVIRKVFLLFDSKAWKRLWNRKIYNHNPEGDIHVTNTDHIEWVLIENIVNPKCEIIKVQDYLVCRETSLERPLHKQFESECSDMRVMIIRKNL